MQAAESGKILDVIVVDDNRTARRAMSALLDTYPGIHVVGEAANGAEAVRMTAEHRPDAVIMDVMMPELDGIEAARRIKNEYPATRVVLITLYGQLERDGKQAGADEFLLKADSADDIVAAIENHPHTGIPGVH